MKIYLQLFDDIVSVEIRPIRYFTHGLHKYAVHRQVTIQNLEEGPYFIGGYIASHASTGAKVSEIYEDTVKDAIAEGKERVRRAGRKAIESALTMHRDRVRRADIVKEYDLRPIKKTS